MFLQLVESKLIVVGLYRWSDEVEVSQARMGDLLTMLSESQRNKGQVMLMAWALCLEDVCYFFHRLIYQVSSAVAGFAVRLFVSYYDALTNKHTYYVCLQTHFRVHTTQTNLHHDRPIRMCHPAVAQCPICHCVHNSKQDVMGSILSLPKYIGGKKWNR